MPTSPRTRLMILLLRLLPKATTPPILATWPCNLSHCGDPTTLAMVPTCPTPTFSNDHFYFWVVFTTTRSPQSKLFWSTVFESSRRHQEDYQPVRVSSTTTVWASACERHLAEGLRRRRLPQLVRLWQGGGLDGLDSRARSAP